jgi:hypothetical protein
MHLPHRHHRPGQHAPDDDRAPDGQIYVHCDGLDFDPDDGRYTGTTVTGSTDIPGDHPAARDHPSPPA